MNLLLLWAVWEAWAEWVVCTNPLNMFIVKGCRNGTLFFISGNRAYGSSANYGFFLIKNANECIVFLSYLFRESILKKAFLKLSYGNTFNFQNFCKYFSPISTFRTKNLNKIIVSLLLLNSVFLLSSEESVKAKKDKLEISPEAKISASAGVSFADRGDKDVNYTLVNNTPEFGFDFYGFVKMNYGSKPNLFFGPYADFSSEIVLRRVEVKSEYLLPRELSGYGQAGFKIGYETSKRNLRGSGVYGFIPFAVNFKANDRDPFNLSPEDVNDFDYYSFVHIGSGIGIEGDLRLRDYFTRFKLSNTLILGIEPAKQSYREERSYLINNVFRVSGETAPFNFINKNVNVFFTVDERITVERNYFSVYFQSRTIAGITWKPVKNFELSFNPARFYYSINNDNKTGVLYNQKSRLEGEIAFDISHKNMGFELGLTQVFWGMNRADYNTKDIHTLTVSAEVYFSF